MSNSSNVPGVNRALDAVDRVLSRLVDGAQWLALPIATLLLLQWPLREIVARFSREANDFGQVLFALFVSVALMAAMRERAHLHTDVLAHRYPPALRKWLEVGSLLFALIPWSLFILVAGLYLVALLLARRCPFLADAQLVDERGQADHRYSAIAPAGSSPTTRRR